MGSKFAQQHSTEALVRVSDVLPHDDQAWGVRHSGELDLTDAILSGLTDRRAVPILAADVDSGRAGAGVDEEVQDLPTADEVTTAEDSDLELSFLIPTELIEDEIDGPLGSGGLLALDEMTSLADPIATIHD